jgi:hypothetical protein
MVYSLHEIPAGVLYENHTGATPSQCALMLPELEEFRQWAELADESETYQPLMEACDFHYRAYAAYLTSEPRLSSYSEYLSRLVPRRP